MGVRIAPVVRSGRLPPWTAQLSVDNVASVVFVGARGVRVEGGPGRAQLSSLACRGTSSAVRAWTVMPGR